MDFVKDKVYKRKELHDKYGGRRQYGISASKDYPLIFLFPTSSGGKYGYEEKDAVFAIQAALKQREFDNK